MEGRREYVETSPSPFSYAVSSFFLVAGAVLFS